MSPIRVGLVGAGPHARSLHAPMWAAGPQTTLAGVWSRRYEAAAELAATHQTRAVRSFDQLVHHSDVVAFAVAPEGQWQLAARAARAGRHLVLEKPIADTLDHARALTDAVEETHVASLVVLTARFLEPVRQFLHRAATFPTTGARLTMFNGFQRTDPPPVTSWRTVNGALLDLGPHVFDLVTAALGPVTRVHATGDPTELVAVQCDHAGNATSQIALSSSIGESGWQYRIELYGPDGMLDLDVNRSMTLDALCESIRHEIHRSVLGSRSPLDVRRGLYLQHVAEAAQRSLRIGPVELAAVGPPFPGPRYRR
ncbi:Gfo/Idh/MocA family protein [Phytohabitans kaempferiae]|uniref:Gfo/Idh/MocA family protein n=1 Tax=Phytohabitans kaempferiae TaxID=1620943 RepID=A0ABV6M9S7_9ACTN